METFNIDPNISLIDLNPPLRGYKHMLGVYVIRGLKTAVLDVGPSLGLPAFFAGLSELKINPEEVDIVLLSHIHLDHSGGIGSAIKMMPNAKVIVHERGVYHLAHPEKLWESTVKVMGQTAYDFGKPEPVPEDKLVAVYEGMTIDLEGIKLEVVLTPGHAPHHYSLLDRKEGRLFAGEAGGVHIEYAGGLRPASPFPFDLDDSLASIDKLINLNPNTIYYSHFGYWGDAVNNLKAYRKQLILWADIIAAHIDDGSDWKTIFQEIKQKDKSVSLIFELPADQMERELYFIKNAINGFISYFTRKRQLQI